MTTTPMRPHWTQRTSLAPLVRLTAVNAAGDACVAVALADTLFFGVPVGQARGRVALYLVLTMAPFAVVAPVLGPLLDRFRQGRRTALALALLARAVLAMLMGSAGSALALYPLAFAVLVLSKGFHLARAAAVPRLLPSGMTLVRANARLAATSLVASTVAGLAAAGITKLTGYHWGLRTAGLIFLAGSVLALPLPGQVNSEPAATGSGAPEHVRGPRFTAPIRGPLIAMATVRALAGFLTMYLAFLLRSEGGGVLSLAVVAAAAAVGGMGGTVLGNTLHETPPRRLTFGSVAAVAATAAVAALSFGLVAAALLAGVLALAAAVGKLGLDAVLQHEVDEDVRGQAFARVETLLQLAWVVGGMVGVALPLGGGIGLGLVAAVAAAGGLTAMRVMRPREVT